MPSDCNATFGHCLIYTPRRFLIFYAPHHHFSFGEDFIPNQRDSTSPGLTLSPHFSLFILDMHLIEGEEGERSDDRYDSRQAHAFQLHRPKDDGRAGETGDHRDCGQD